MDEDHLVAADLDGADLAEVARRVVQPVLSALLRPGELDWYEVELSSRLPDDGWAPSIRVVLLAGGDRFESVLCEATFGREDAEDCADALSSALEDWLCYDTAFAWGQQRGLGADLEVPPREWPAGRVVEFYAGEETASPLWARGVNLPLTGLPLSDALTADVAAWSRRYVTLVGVDEEDAGDVSWADVVAELEPWRFRLVDRLREELIGFVVLRPQPLPT